MTHFECLNIEPDGWNRRYGFIQFHTVQNGCFASRIETEDEDPHIFGRDQVSEHGFEVLPHSLNDKILSIIRFLKTCISKIEN